MDEKRTVRDGYDAIADDYAAQRTLDGRGTDLVRAFAADLPEGRVLDAGCGGGVPASAVLAERHDVVGMDLSAEQLGHLRENVPAAAPVAGDLTDLPFSAGAFDGLASLFAVIHVPRERHGDVFAEFNRVLRPGGEALVVVGSDAWEGRNPDWLDTGTEMFWSFYGPERNRDLLRDAGFTVEREELVNDELGGDFLFVRVTAEGE
ncbi:class I SAM-dependent methyltransferase [Halorarius halobius]|uniref:class I SAM-dependent methyltransferase n=1 Tax=Halorarius halobius TaxID=2962671 RepID=UPI0020CE23C9|nr:class I SAM-dependent methyltransferase [Halorarius halobius]